ncbi:MAG: type I restriction endonuclease subunit S [Actinomycetota bacterium]
MAHTLDIAADAESDTLLSRHPLASIEMPWPVMAAARAYSSDDLAVRDAAESGSNENRTLAATRDALLPQLTSGALRIKDVEKAIEGVL